jgi:hypothetical protein
MMNSKSSAFNTRYPSAIFLIISAILVACKPSTEVSYQRIEAKNGYSIEIISSMIPSNSLNSEASLQYVEEMRQLFIIVLDEEKEAINSVIAADEELADYYSQDLAGFSELIMDNFVFQMDVKQAEHFKDTTIQNHPAKTIRLSATLNDVEIFYSLAFIEGERNYYQIWSWTHNESVSENLPLMEHMLFSFKEDKENM